jgi:hypothetical protein
VPSGRFSELLQQLSLDLAVGEDEAADILLQVRGTPVVTAVAA